MKGYNKHLIPVLLCSLGWGTTEQGGPKSDKLMEAELNVVNIAACQAAFGSKVSTSDQLCTFGAGTDACQVPLQLNMPQLPHKSS
jgi:hypothetical protein